MKNSQDFKFKNVFNSLYSLLATRYFFIAIFLAAFSVYWVHSADAGFLDIFSGNNIPQHPAVKVVDEQAMVTNGITMKTLLLRAEGPTPSELANYYITALGQRGWQLAGAPAGEAGIAPSLSFKHSDGRILQMQITMGGPAGETNALSIRMMYSTEGLKKWTDINLEDKNPDMPGQDLDWLHERYPSSVRASSMQYGTGYTAVLYIVPDYSCLECVVDFYRQAISKKGWQLFGEVHKTKAELMQQNSPIMDMLREAYAQAQADKKFGDTMGPVNLEKLMEQYQPDEIKSLQFRKGSDVCVVSISYWAKGSQDLFKLNSLPPEQQQLMAQEIENNRSMKMFLLQQKERVEISLTHMPGAAAQAQAQAGSSR